MRFAIALIVALTFVAQTSWAEEWNQEAVAGIAGELATAIGEAEAAFGKLAAPAPGSGARRSFYAARDDARALKNTANRLSKAVAAGEGHDETLPTYKRLGTVRRDTAENMRSAGVIPEDVQAKIETARVLLEKLDAYYTD